MLIAGIGELLVEFLRRDGAGHEGPGAYAGPYPSGAPGIFADQAARIAGRALMAGAVGADAFGRVVTRRLAADGVLPDLLRVAPDLPTGTAHVAYDAEGGRSFVFNIAASAAARLPDADEILRVFRARGAGLLHVSGSAIGDPAMRALILRVAEECGALGMALSVDPNIRPELAGDAGYLPAMRRLVAMADYVLPSDADLAALWPGMGFADVAGGLIAGGARLAALKRGAAGAVAVDAGGMTDLPGHAVTVVDPTGAGDCFCATLVACLGLGLDRGAALAHANAAGALAVQALGPMEGNSDLAAIGALLARA